MSKRFLALVILLLGFGVRVWQLDAESIWHDEGWSIRAIHSPFGTPDDNTPYVYYITGHLLWRLGAGNSAFALRYVSVLIGLVTVAVALYIGQRWFGHHGSWTFGFLIAISPLLWDYAQEVRAYVAVPLIALLLLLWVESLLHYPRQRSIPHRLWISIWLTECVGLYTHNLAVPLVAWTGLTVGVVWLFRKNWQRLITWCALHILLGIAYIPWVMTQSPSGTNLNTPPQIGFTLARDIWYSYFLPVLAQVRDAESPILIILAAIISLVAIPFFVLKRPLQGGITLSQALLVPLFSTALLLAAHIDFHPRYFIAGTPAALLVLVGGTQAISSVKIRNLSAIVIAILMGIISYQSLHDIHTTRTYQHDDFAAVAKYYANLPEDAVILIPFDDEPALQYYFASEYDIKAQFINVPLHSKKEIALSTIQELASVGSRHVELLTWFQLPADVRGMYPCFLGSNSETIGETQRFFGLSTQTFMLSRIPDPKPLPIEATFAEGDLRNVFYMASQEGVCVFTEWHPKQNNGETSIVSQILNPIEETIARQDAVIRNAAQESNLKDYGASFHWLPLPRGAPLDDYTIAFTVYNQAKPSGFDVIQNNRIIGKTVQATQPIRARGKPLTETPSIDQLLSDSVGDMPLNSGSSFTVTLLIHQAQIVSLVGEGWRIESPIMRDPELEAQLSWHHFTIPPDANGEVELWAGATLLKTYVINPVEHLFEQPSSQVTTSATFEGIGELVGYSVTHPYDVTLVWQAHQTTDIPYMVFVQFIAPDGRVIAQSDSQPANGERPTTSWIPNEYIIDNHRLSSNIEQYKGKGTLIIGFYNPDTFERVLTTEGQDFYQLPTEYLVD